VVILGKKQWLCAQHDEEYVELRGSQVGLFFTADGKVFADRKPVTEVPACGGRSSRVGNGCNGPAPAFWGWSKKLKILKFQVAVFRLVANHILPLVRRSIGYSLITRLDQTLGPKPHLLPTQ
jgi:hypothetical protein